jgi:curved DNA-binding protein CbpA
MKEEPFVDYYEILQVSPNADAETIQRVFRFLAKRFHPDNIQTGDGERFDTLVKAQRILTDPEQRAAYDVRHQRARDAQMRLMKDAAAGFDNDQAVRERILALLYAQRRRDMNNPGVGGLELERMLSCPREHLEFHVWYMREKGWVTRTDSGYLAITVAGVDQTETDRQHLRKDRLLTGRVEDTRQGLKK